MRESGYDRRMNVLIRAMGLAVLLGVSGAVQAAAEDVTAGSTETPALEARDAWIRTPAPGSPVMAGYVSLHNPGKREIRIVKAQSDVFGAIEIHEMRDVGGVMRMRPVPDLVLQPGERVSLQPGGLHLMLFRPVAIPAEGDSVEIRLVPEQGEPVPVMFEVRDEAP